MNETYTLGTYTLRSIPDEVSDPVKATEIFAKAGNQTGDLKILHVHTEEGLK